MAPILWIVGLAAAATLFVAGWRVADRLLEWPHRREWVMPLHIALHEVLGYPEDMDPRRYLHVPRDFQDGTEVVVDLPRTFEGSRKAKQAVAKIVRIKLGLNSLVEDWHLAERNPYVALRARSSTD